MEVGGLAHQWLVGGTQRLEGCVPGIGQHDKPDHTRHQGIVDDDKDDHAGQGLIGAGERDGRYLSDIPLCVNMFEHESMV